MGGNNYGLNDSLEYYEYEFDSSDTTNTMDSTYSTLDWPLFTSGRPLNSIAAIKILEVQIPFSWYTINSNNNTFLLDEPGFSPQQVTVTLTPGNYNATTFATEVARAMNAVTRLTPAPPLTGVYALTYDTATGIYTITSQTTLATQSSVWFMTFNNLYTTPAPFLGFGTGTYTASTTVSPSYRKVVAPNVAQVTGPNYLYVNSRKMGQQINLFLPEGAITKGELSPQMCKIPINCNPGGVIFWQTADPQKWYVFSYIGLI